MYVLDQDLCKNTSQQWVMGRDGAALCHGGLGRSCPSPSLAVSQEGATNCGLQTPGPCSLAAVQVLRLKSRCPRGHAACRETLLTSLSFWWWPKPRPSWAARCTRAFLASTLLCLLPGGASVFVRSPACSSCVCVQCPLSCEDSSQWIRAAVTRWSLLQRPCFRKGRIHRC